jgi:Zn-dependent protease
MVELALLSTWAFCMIGGSAVLHECGHAWAARAVGWNVVGLRYRWYGVAVVAETNGRTDQLWKVAAGGLVATALLALVFLAGMTLPEPAPLVFGVGFTFNATFLVTQLVPVRRSDGGQLLAGLRKVRSGDRRSEGVATRVFAPPRP